MTRLMVTALMLMLGGAALAHADLLTSEPLGGTVLEAAPEQVLLEFTEPIEVMFSVFKVYRLEAEVDPEADNAQQRLNGLAAALVNDVLELREDGEGRVDSGVQTSAASVSEVPLLLQEDLAAGHYVVMWKVLSIDTHVTQGFFVFSVSD